MSETPAKLMVHPLVEIHHDDARSRVSLRVAGRQRGHVVSELAADVIRAVARDVDLPGGDESAAVVRWLLSNQYLFQSDDPEFTRVATTIAEWESNNWSAAARYHFETYGYPFEKYQKGRSPVDSSRMNAYVVDQHDLDRGKTYADVTLQRIILPQPTEVVLDIPADYQLIPRDAAGWKSETSTPLLDALSLIALPVRRDAMPWPNSRKVLRKTSPSGGSRHPTETYIFNRSADFVEPGIYHVNGDEGVLDRVFDEPRIVSDGIDAVTPNADAVLIFTSRFARNRFRYREPRTFRTVHMDVGHVLTTSEYILEALGFEAESYTTFDLSTVSELLRLDPLIEHPVAAVAIRGSSSPAEGRM